MPEDYTLNLITYFLFFALGVIAIFAFMMFMASKMTWTDVNMQIFNMTFYIFFALLIIGSVMFSIEKK